MEQARRAHRAFGALKPMQDIKCEMRDFPPASKLRAMGLNAAELDALPDWISVGIASAGNTVYVLAKIGRVPDDEDREALDLIVTTLTADTYEGQFVTGRFATDAVPGIEPADLPYQRCWP